MVLSVGFNRSREAGSPVRVLVENDLGCFLAPKKILGKPLSDVRTAELCNDTAELSRLIGISEACQPGNNFARIY